MFKKPIKQFDMDEALEFSLAQIRFTRDLIEECKKQIEEADAGIKLVDSALEKIINKFEGDSLSSAEKIFEDAKNMLATLESQENNAVSYDEKFILNAKKQMVQNHLSNPIFDMLAQKEKLIAIKAEFAQKRDSGIDSLKKLEESLKNQEETVNTHILKTEEQRANRGKMELYFVANRCLNNLPVSLTQEDLKKISDQQKLANESSAENEKPSLKN